MFRQDNKSSLANFFTLNYMAFACGQFNMRSDWLRVKYELNKTLLDNILFIAPSEQETKMAAHRTQQSTSIVSQKNWGL